MDKKAIFALVGAGAVAIGIGVWAYFKKKEEYEDDEPQVNPVGEGFKTMRVENEKPSLDEYKLMLENQGYSVEIQGYAVDKSKNADKPEKVKVEENSPHICSEEDYISTYADYDHFTCTWYPGEKRLVNLDDEWNVMVPIREYVGVGAEKVLMGKTVWSEDFVMYAVDPTKERVYEILVNLDTSYMEDMENHILVAGGDD